MVSASHSNEMAAGFGSFVLLEHAVENEHQLLFYNRPYKLGGLKS